MNRTNTDPVKSGEDLKNANTSADTTATVEMQSTNKNKPPDQSITNQNPTNRIYVRVLSLFDSEGAMIPQSILWKDGRIFKIEKVTGFRSSDSIQNDSNLAGDCYTVTIKGKEKHIYYQRFTATQNNQYGRWWVETSCSCEDAGSQNTTNSQQAIAAAPKSNESTNSVA